MTLRWLGLGLMAAACWSLARPAGAADEAWALPQQGADPAAFTPRGWSVEETFDSDLDGDGAADKVIVLLQDELQNDSDTRDVERHRALVTLRRQADGYTLVGCNRRILMSFGDGGVKGGVGTPELRNQRGTLVVSQMQGSREFEIWEHHFRWSRKRQRFELVGRDSIRSDAATGASTWLSCNFLTRACVEKVTPPQVDSDGHELRSVPKIRRWQLPRVSLVAFELVEREE
ncbi:MAG TPA: hypothetical protein VER12_09815 [Polyangiaceae bacterium]|nr:hypothetical protein [Polyangiaceae bacterium]